MARYAEMLLSTTTRATKDKPAGEGPPLIQREGVKRFTWVCGPERVLVEEVVDAIRAHVDPDPMDYVSLTAGEVKDRDVWTQLNQYPILGEKVIDTKVVPVRRLVVVRDAERIKNWEPFHEWFAATDMGLASRAAVCAVFVSNMEDWPATWLPDVREKVVKQARLIDCRLNDAEALKYLGSKGNIDAKNAAYLLQRVGGDITKARDCLQKMRFFKKAIGPSLIDALTTYSPSTTFVDDLLSMKKPSALSAIEQIPLEEYGQVIGLLEWNLAALTKLARLVRTVERGNRRELEAKAKLKRPTLDRLLPLVHMYDRKKVVDRLHVLAFIDDWYQQGAREGLLEVAVARW